MTIKKDEPKKIKFSAQEIVDEQNEQVLKKHGDAWMDIVKNATGSARKKGVSIALTEDPVKTNTYAGIYKLKTKLLPPEVIKQIRIQNLLVAAILRARGNALTMFAQPRASRFDIGFEIDIRPEFKDHIEPEQLIKIQERMAATQKLIMTCGYEDGLKDIEKTTFPDFLYQQGQNGCSFGQFATEWIYEDKEQTKLNRFRVVDAGSIYRAVKKGESAQSVRQASIKLLEQLTGDKLQVENFEKDQYDWVQVVDGTPRQAFTSKELSVYNLFPCSDIELAGYPVTPMDTAITSITTYMSIELYNKLYFQNGRSAKGMIILNSDDIGQDEIEDVKQQFNASINNVTNSFRTPIFAVGEKDTVQWMSTEPGSKDQEFSFLSDQVSRNILAAFNIDPSEVPGFQHLSKGTNQQSLSESSNQYKLEASRDGGLRPLILKFQDFVNQSIFKKIDPELYQLCTIKLSGLDAETNEQENTRLETESSIHMSYDDILNEVDKKVIGPSVGGNLPLNDRFRAAADAYVTAGVFAGQFLESPSAYVDPMMKYKKDAFFFQNMDYMKEANPMAVQAFYATREDSLDLLKRLLQDYLEEN
jgi:hypothetical protein